MFGDRPFTEPSLLLIGALVFAILFEAVSVLVDFVATGDFRITGNSIMILVVAFFGYLAVGLLVRAKSRAKRSRLGWLTAIRRNGAAMRARHGLCPFFSDGLCWNIGIHSR